MKTRKNFILIIFLTVSLVIPSPVYAQDNNQAKVIFGGNFILSSGETLNGDLVVFGGTAKLENGSRVNGDVAVIGGNLSTDGTIHGDLVAMGGFVELGSQTLINGDLTVLGSNLERSSQAIITGSMMSTENILFELNSDLFTRPNPGKLSTWQYTLTPLVSLMWFLLKLLIWAGLAGLVFLFLENQLKVISQTAFDHPGGSFVTGLGVITMGPLITLLLAVTILLIPISLFTAFILVGSWVLGWLALGYEVGRRLSDALNQSWSPLINTVLGTFAVMLIFNGFEQITPWCTGWVPKLIIGMWMLGAVALSRFGSRLFPAEEPLSPKISSGDKLSNSKAGEADQPDEINQGQEKE